MAGDHTFLLEGLIPEGQSLKQSTPSSFVKGPEYFVSKALQASFSPMKTKIFKNLCDPKELEEWNAMRANSKIHIMKEKDIQAPKNAVELIDAIRVDYVEVNEVVFNITLTMEVINNGLDPVNYVIVMMDDAASVKSTLLEVINCGEGDRGLRLTYVFKTLQDVFRYSNPKNIDSKIFVKTLIGALDNFKNAVVPQDKDNVL